MRRRELIALLLLLALLTSFGCTRLTFVKPSLKRHNYEQIAPEYKVRDDPRDAQRVVAIDQVALAEQSFQAGELDDAASHASRALKADPKSSDAYTLLAMVE